MSGQQAHKRAAGSRRAGPNPIANDRRRARKRSKLPPDAACILCGITAPEVLIPVLRSFIDGDHVSGDANDPDLVVPLCKNCHAIRTAHQHDEGVDLSHTGDRSVLTRQAGARQSRAALFRDLAEAEEREAVQRIALEEALDHKDPSWRDLPEAKP